MLILKTTEEYTNKKDNFAVVTIGNFDGVHIGHQALLLRTVNKAKEVGGTSVAVTFEPHPTQVISQTSPPKLITSYIEKNKLISAQGIDVLFCIPFTQKFATMSALTFVKELLLEQIGMKILVIGQDYSFGKDRIGNVRMLKTYADKLNFKVIIEDWVKLVGIANTRISSSIIRNMIMEGKVENASMILGRNYCMHGLVVHGKKRGKKLLGFPTANIDPDNNLYPKIGVYAVTIEYKKQVLNGVANLGNNPTFKNEMLSLEVHILSFDHELYGERIKINFIKRLRSEINFSTISKLRTQIHKDIEKVKKILITERL